jgi:hypothetical protein
MSDFEKLGAFYAIAWEPWHAAADGFPRPASTL